MSRELYMLFSYAPAGQPPARADDSADTTRLFAPLLTGAVGPRAAPIPDDAFSSEDESDPERVVDEEDVRVVTDAVDSGDDAGTVECDSRSDGPVLR